MRIEPITFLGDPHPPHASWHAARRIDGWPGDATYGWSTEQLLQPHPLPPVPEGFRAFWDTAFCEATDLPYTLNLDEELRAPRLVATTHQLFQASFTSTDDVRIGCWVFLPRDEEPRTNVTFGHGYGGRTFPELDERLLAPGDAAILPVARGLPTLSLHNTIPSESNEHVVHGIADPKTYVLRGCVQDLWRASAELNHLVGSHPHSYQGTSFGGGTGAIALFGGQYDRAVLNVPTFGNHPLRVTLPCVGSGAAVTQYVQAHPEALDVLAFFDAATAASYATTPTLVSAALWDPAVPPPGQFAIYHALSGPKRLLVASCGHTDYPGCADEDAQWASIVKQWLHPVR